MSKENDAILWVRLPKEDFEFIVSEAEKGDRTAPAQIRRMLRPVLKAARKKAEEKE